MTREDFVNKVTFRVAHGQTVTFNSGAGVTSSWEDHPPQRRGSPTEAARLLDRQRGLSPLEQARVRWGNAELLRGDRP